MEINYQAYLDKIDLSKFFLQGSLNGEMEFTVPLSMCKGDLLALAEELILRRIELKEGVSSLEDQVLVDERTGYQLKLSGLKKQINLKSVSTERNLLINSLTFDFKRKKSKTTETPQQEVDEDLD